MQSTDRGADRTTRKQTSLKEICFQAIKQNFAVLLTGAADLPVPLIQELLPYLNICELDELQPALNQRGISTHSAWVGVLRDMCSHATDFHTEEEAKREVMRMIFTLVFYGYRNAYVIRNITDLNRSSFLWTAAKWNQHFLLSSGSHQHLHSLTAEQRPLLNLLEKNIRSVGVSQCPDPSNRKTHPALHVLHRLLDHGGATKLVVDEQCPVMLAWLLHGRGTQYVHPELKNPVHSRKWICTSQTTSAGADGRSCSPGLETSASDEHEDQPPPCKRSKLDSVPVEEEEEESGRENFTFSPQVLCQTFTPCDAPSAGTCPWGQITHLEIRQCRPNSLKVLIAALPTFFCLRSLTLHSIWTLWPSDVMKLARALKQLSDSSRSSITDLSISVLPNAGLMEILLDASPSVTSLHVEIQTVIAQSCCLPHHLRTDQSDMSVLPLDKLTVKAAEIQTDLHFITSVLRRSPRLTSLHVAGMRLPRGSSQSQLLTTLSESNHCLRTLNLEDMKLSDCLPEILNLLRDCKLEELQLNDCRLLEKCSNSEESLQQLVAALKTLPCLHTLSLAQNRLARSVCVLAELFSGSSPSSVKRLDISSNFIQPAELLEFAKRLKMSRPPHRLTLDLRKNPGDRDPDTWKAALKWLHPFSVLLVEGWRSTDTMVDHVSIM